MQRYFFHLHDGRTTLDAEGVELPNLRAARGEAVRACGDLLRDVPAALLSGQHAWCLWATDQPNDQGAGLFTVTLTMKGGRPG